MSRPWACDYHRAIVGEREFWTVRCRFFEIGLGRTGTRSVYVAAKQLGLRAVHGTGGCPMCEPEMMTEMECDGTDMPMYKTYDYCGHLPVYHWKQLAEERPDAKFILTLRPIEEWVESAVKRYGRGRARPNKRSEYIRLRYFGTCKPSRERLKEGYFRHKENVINYFKRNDQNDRLLVLNIFEDSDSNLWKAMSEFMYVPIPPEKPFPKKTTPIRLFRSGAKP